ncbi:MAG: serine hydrolase domain-containing protein [Brevundimonas sp.]
MFATRRALLGGFAVLPLAGAFPALARVRTDDAAGAALDAVFAETAPPALAAGIVTREGLGWAGVRGVRRAGSEDAATLEDRWHLGSNTKAMTAAVFGRLVEAGLTTWDHPLTDIFPEIAADPAWRGVTLETVMAHRSGLRDDDVLPREVRVAARDDARPLVEQRLDRVRAALSVPPGGVAGAFAYANCNFVIAGAVIERLTGAPWEAAIADHLFQPLGITAFGFGAPTGDQPWGHQIQDGVPVPLDPVLKPDNPPLMGPAGTAHMSLADYARFVAAMMGGRPDWLNDETRRHLLTPAAGDPPAYAAGWAVGSAPWAGVSGPGPTITHNGSNTLWFATVLAAPERGLGFIALSNDGVAGQRACTALVQRLAAGVVAG